MDKLKELVATLEARLLIKKKTDKEPVTAEERPMGWEVDEEMPAKKKGDWIMAVQAKYTAGFLLYSNESALYDSIVIPQPQLTATSMVQYKNQLIQQITDNAPYIVMSKDLLLRAAQKLLAVLGMRQPVAGIIPDWGARQQPFNKVYASSYGALRSYVARVMPSMPITISGQRYPVCDLIKILRKRTLLL